MKTTRETRFSSVAPIALRVAFKDHVHALEDEALRLIGKSDDALEAQQVRPAFLRELVQPRQQLVRVDELVR